MNEEELRRINKNAGFTVSPNLVYSAPFQVTQHTTFKYEYDNKPVEGEAEITREPGNWIRVYASKEEYENQLSNLNDFDSIKFRFTCGADIDLSWLPNTNEGYWSWNSNQADEITQETLLYLGDEEEPLTVYSISFADNMVNISFEGQAITMGDTHFYFESNSNRELLGNTCEFAVYK